jgi:isopentenyl diphosphate isomerase/L-lactate dehydrogenase-like FMN-dependent dehydrogenase
VTSQSGTYIPGATTYEDMRERAREVMSTAAFDYVVGGAGEERTLAANRAGFGRYRLLPRVLEDVSRIDTSVEVLGTRLSAPIFTCPTGGVSFVYPDGEACVARAAAAAGVAFVLAAHTGVTTEQGAAAAGPARWHQFYWQGNRHVMADLVERAEGSGFKAIFLTVDNAVIARRPRMMRTGSTVTALGAAEASATNYVRYMASEWQERVPLNDRGRPAKLGTPEVALTWKNVEWLRSLIHVPFVIKGIRTPDDALRAVEIGADGIVVSNHGGRNLDSEPGTIELLEDVLEAVNGRATVMLDGGVRRASDIAIALGLGAAAVGLGSPVVWALAYGEENVTAFLSDLVEDLAITFGMMGVSSVAGLTRAHVSRRDEFLPDWALPAFTPPR